jgi:hypothetical protein
VAGPAEPPGELHAGSTEETSVSASVSPLENADQLRGPGSDPKTSSQPVDLSNLFSGIWMDDYEEEADVMDVEGAYTAFMHDIWHKEMEGW